MADEKEKLRAFKDPYRSFRFKVELDGIISGGFTDVSGLTVETEVETRGENYFEYKLPKASKFSNLTLKRGISDDSLWDWYKNVMYGKIERKNISVCLLNEEGTEVVRWDFQEAYPVKWDGPTLNAGTASVAFESIVIVHHGFQKQK